jgi:Tol biopolymer transport system component
MWPRRRVSPADHLSRYWTALVAGAPAAEVTRLAEPLDAEVLAVIERMRALRTRHRPDPAFLDRLERDALAVFGRGRTVPAAAGPPDTASVPARETRLPSTPRLLPRVGRQTRRWAIAEIAVVAMVLIAVGLGYWILNDNPTADKSTATIAAPSVVPTAWPSPPATPAGTPPTTAPGAGINVVNADGTGLTGLGGDAAAADPVWSPDGSRIAFASKDGIYVMNADGTGRTLILDLPPDTASIARLGGMGNRNPGRLPAWSPDGSRIAFADARGTIYVVGSDGSNPTKVADPGEPPTVSDSESFEPVGGYDWRPVWSPGGDRLAIVSGLGPARQIILIDGIDVGDPVASPLGELSGDITGPAWSPDGSMIAFFVTSADATSGVYVVAPGQGEPRRLTDVVPNAESPPTWSPDGDRLMFVADDGVWAVRTDGSGLEQVTAIPPGARSVVWSPDGSRIAFVADGLPYVINLDGSSLRRLAALTVDQKGLVWSPDGGKVIFSSPSRG